MKNSMKTSCWTPQTTVAAQAANATLGITDRVIVNPVGKESMELGVIAAMYLCLNLLRNGERFNVTNLEGLEVAYTRNDKVAGDQNFCDALYVMEYALLQERQLGMESVIRDLEASIGNT